MQQATPEPYSAEEYFSFLLQCAKRAEAQGNYAISAAAAVRYGGVELVSLGSNTVFADENPTGHAEVNAIMSLRSVARATPRALATALLRGEQQGSLIVRPAPDERAESVLYTTLEPCPMCTVCIINAGIDRVVVAAEDPPSGSLAPDRLAALPVLWPQLGRDLDVLWCQSTVPVAVETFLPSELRDELLELFLRSRTNLDYQLGRHGTLDIRAVGERVAAVRKGDLRTESALALSAAHSREM